MKKLIIFQQFRNDKNYNMTSTMSSLSASTSTSSSAAFRPLSETDLERQPEEVFDLVEEIGKGSYGTVHRAILKENNLEVAIKKVQVADELHEIIKGGEFIKGYISQWKITRIYLRAI